MKIFYNLLSVWPLFSIYVIILGVSSVVIPILKIEILERIVNALLSEQYTHWIQLVMHAFWFALLFLIELVFQSRSFLDYFGLIYQKKFILKNYSTFLLRRSNMSVKLFEDVRLQDSLDQIQNFFNSDFSTMLITFQRIITIGALTLATLFKISQYNIFLVIFLILIAIIILFNNHRISAKNLKYEKQRTILNRMIGYIYSLFVNKQALSENKVYQNHDYIKNKWVGVSEKNLKELNRNFNSVQPQQFVTTIVSSFYAVTAILLLYVLNFYIFKISVASFVALIYTIQQFESNIGSLMQKYYLIYHFINLSEQLLEFNEQYQFRTEVKGEQYEPFKDDLILHDVCYQYPRSDRQTVSNVNLTIKKGEKISIIGENGAGKTTLIRLILGLIPPTGGKILIDQKDIALMNPNDYYQNFSCVFQNMPRYVLSVRDNVTISNQSKKIGDDELDALFEQFNMHKVVMNLPRHYDTILSKDLGEADLSGGEWQKLSIIRAIFRDSDIVIFDEPTSAMDPIAEYDLYKMINESLKDKTVITISHRLASAKMADKIIFMKDGYIVEEGRHDELMLKKGYYFDLFSTQQQWYQRNSDDITESL